MVSRDRERERSRARDDERGDPRAWIPRVLAPAAFFAAATLLVLVVHRSLNASPEQAASPPAPPAAVAGTTGATTTTNRPPSQRRFYRIRAGDTLDQIAIRFDTTVDDLLTLNPGIEANALTPGQRIRVR
jgi:LysM repeat protein